MAGTLIAITRTDAWTNNYDVYAKANTAPLEDGDGTYIMSGTMLPSDTTIYLSWTAPDDRTYKFRVIPVYRKEAGPGTNT